MTRLLVVTGAAVWPARNGGQVRVAGLVEGLASHFDVHLAHPSQSGHPRGPVPVAPLSPGRFRRSDPRPFLSRRPRLGHAALGSRALVELRALIVKESPTAVLFTHSYLTAMMNGMDVPILTDFQNLEVERMRSMARRGTYRNRASASLEALKADRWEPAVARGSAVSIALTDHERAVLDSWGGNAITVPNGVFKRPDVALSPVDGPVVFVGSADYAPNRDGVNWLVNTVWPRVVASQPDAHLQIAGRNTHAVFSELTGKNVQVLGEVDDVDNLYANAAVVAVPVWTGGGQQLKVLEALSHGRVLVATPFSAKSVPEHLNGLCTVASDHQDFAAAILTGLQDVTERYQRELKAKIAVSRIPTWEDVVAPLVAAIRNR